MDTRNIKDIYPLSPMQQGMLFHSLYAPESGMYFEQSSWTLRGDLDVSAFERAWRRVIERHSTLRTAFLWEELDEPLQVVCRQVELDLEEQDWRGCDEIEQQSRLDAFLSQDRERGFGLDKAPLMRLALIRLDDNVYHFVWSHHHLLLDGWSQPILFQEVFGFYEAFSQGQDLHLPPLRPYRDYIAWLQQQDGAETKAFWRRTLQGFVAPTVLTVEGILEKEAGEPDAGLVKEGEGYASQRALLPAETMEALQTLARQNQLTLNTLVQGSWALLLSRYSGEEDVVFGATVSGRPPDLPGAETMVGLFINTLPVRVQIEPEATTLEWLKELQAKQAELRQYEHTFLVDVQGWSEVPRDLPLFESLLVFENYPITDAVREQESSLRIESGPSFSRTNYPLLLAVSPGREMGLEIAYDAQRFGAGTIRRMLTHLQTLLKGIVANPQQPLEALPVLTEAERHQLLVEWNTTKAEYPRDRCVHELFEAQVEQTPDGVAVVFSQTDHLTYDELNRRANQLAHYLQKLGVGPEVLVGICVERSLEMVVGMLGILKAGGAYVPMDPANPQGRLDFMLEDTRVPVLLTQTHLADQLPNLQVIRLDADWETIAQESDENPTVTATPDNLAYVIYTSGSTGRPKGVLLEHWGFCNQVVGWARHFEIKPRDRILQFLSFGFDGSIVEFFPTLVSGATLHLIPRQMALSLPDLHQLLQEQKITTLTMTPSALAVLPSEELPFLKIVISGGEKCTRKVAARWALGRRFANVYGPTEATVTAAWYDVDELHDEGANIPIGRPFPNVRLYVLDKHLSPVPIGVPGELYIGGVGVARGYLNRPELTTERFIPDLFSADPEARLYKTGDLVRYLPDGNIEFLGRTDFQVKIRGFRVELGEIEAALNRHPAVHIAAVLDRKDDPGNPYLAAYIVPEGDDLDLSVLHTYLKEQLPAYMVPAGYVVMDALPLTPSGKINRRALPAPEGRAALETAYVAPRTPVEDGLTDIWGQVLGVDRVGVHDDFFDLGGHSLLATQLVSRVREVFQVEVPLRDLFETPTVVGLAERVEAALRAASGLETPPIVPVSRDGDLPLSFAQQRLWFLDQLAPGNLFYNIPMAVRLKGQLDVAALEQSVNEIVRRHESLRTIFATVDGKPVQVIAPELAVPLPVVDLTGLPEAKREKKAHRLTIQKVRQPFDLAQGPLLQAQLLRLGEKDHIALLTMHHIVSDGWSMAVLIREIATLYGAFSAEKPSPLPELPIQYADFAHWQREWLQGEVLEAQLDYWKQQLSGSPPMLELPTDRPRPAVQTSQGATQSFVLPKELAESLKALGREEGATLFMTLLAAFQTLLYRYTGQEDINVGTPIANRTRGEIEGLIGFFVNTLVMRTDLSGDPSFEELLARVREAALDAYAHQDLPFETLVEELQPDRDLSHTPLFQVMFVLDTAAGGTLELPGLTLSRVEVGSGTATFDLTLSVTSGPDGLGGYVEYNTDLFDEATITRMLAHFQILLEGIAADPDQRISRLPILTEAEQQQLLVEWNETAIDFPRETCIHHLFEAHVEERPGAVAATFEGAQLTYQELNRRANQLAHYLQKLGVGPEVLVGISTERSLEMVVGILGTLKAGGAYLPLDPTYPQERLAFMLEDSQVPVLLTQERLVEHLPISNLQVVCLDTDWEAIAQESGENLEGGATAESLAYVIYTSGSTGKPKGTMLRHRGLCNLTDAQRRAFNIREGSRVLQFSPLSFDASVWETFMALRNGATLCLARQETLASGPDLAQLMREERVTNVTLPPSVLAVLLEEDLPDLETVISAGEACTPELVARWAPGRDFFNAYGPTETTVCASMYLCDENDAQPPPIGRPIANTQLYILDRNLQPVPVGVPGELLVGGVSLARGYLNRPELTEKKFIPAPPFASPPSGEDRGRAESRLYKTGDLVRYRADGNIDFLGRIDHQVKLRGFRIELGEIEAVLGGYPGVQDGAVVVREDVPGDKRLVAYVVPMNEVEPSVGELRSFLRQTLPEYMVPSLFITLESLPLSPSGKVDRRALPVPDRSRPELEREYVPPRNETEEKLAAMCAELLGVDRVGVYDSFFDLGGHSLLATQFISRVRDAFEVELPLRTLFEHPNVAELAEALERVRERGTELQAPAIVPVSREDRRVRRSALSRDGGGSSR